MKTLIKIFLFLTSSLVYSQNNYSQIIEAYGNEWVNNHISINNEELLVFLSNYSQKGFQVEQVDEGKYDDSHSLEWVPLISKQGDSVSVNQFMSEYHSPTFNPLKYRFYPQNEEQIFKLKGVNFIIRIRTQAFILN